MFGLSLIAWPSYKSFSPIFDWCFHGARGFENGVVESQIKRRGQTKLELKRRHQSRGEKTSEARRDANKEPLLHELWLVLENLDIEWVNQI